MRGFGNMDGNASDRYDRRSGDVVRILRHAVPGNFDELHEINCFPLNACGMDLASAIVLPAGNFLAEVMFNNTAKASDHRVKSLLANPGTWHLMLNVRGSYGLDNLLAVVWSESASALLADLAEKGVAKMPVLFRVLRTGHLVLVNGTTIKQMARAQSQ